MATGGEARWGRVRFLPIHFVNAEIVFGSFLHMKNVMFATVWRWFFRLALCVGAIWALLTIYIVIGMSRATVHQSDRWIEIPTTEEPKTLSKSFPTSATRYRYATSSIGMGGRFLAYSVNGEPNDLDLFARAEIAAHWKKPKAITKDDQSTPFDDDYISFLEDAYGVKLDWLRGSKSGIGTVYRDSERRGSHMPSIFVDKTNSMLYFVMTD